MKVLDQSRNDSEAQKPAQPGGLPLIEKNAVPLLVFIIALATFLCYLPVLFNFFAGDDFVHLTWLKQAMGYPQLIWKNFHSSWLDGTTTKFYRPLISVFMVTDYMTWGLNGLGFHITNLLFHLTSTIVLFFVSLRLGKTFSGESTQSTIKGSALSFAFFASLIFGLYPLHPEAVSWITGRVDTIVTTFIIVSLWCYMQWRDGKSILWCAGSIVSLILGLLSKEMAITLPATMAAYEVLLWWEKGGTRKTLIPGAISAIKAIVPFAVVIALYFVVRLIALGTFVGGYDDSLFFISNMKDFVYGWLHALKMLLIPANKDFFDTKNPLLLFWQVSLGFIAISSLANFAALKRTIPVFLFSALWLAFALLPVYKIFAISDDLQGSRLAYLATVPLSLLMAFGFTTVRALGNPIAWMRVANRLRIVWGALFVTAAAAMLWTNNQAWVAAGEQSNAIRQELDAMYKNEIQGDPQVLFLGLPDHIHGSYVCRNALYGMTKSPQMHRDIEHNIMVDKFEPIMPFGYLKTSLQESRDKVRVYRWDLETKKFVAINLPDKSIKQLDAKDLSRVYESQELKNLLKVADNYGIKNFAFDDKSIASVVTETPKGRRPALQIDLNLPCFTTDFVAITVLAPSIPQDNKGLDLLYKNEINRDFNLYHRAHANLVPSPQPQKLIFALHSEPEWALGGTSSGFELYLPLRGELKILSVETVPASELMPTIDFKNSGFMGTKGFLHLGKDKLKDTVSYDAKSVPGSTGVVFELTRPNLLFASQNDKDECLVTLREIKSSGTTGSVTLERKDFTALGIYELRAWAVDKDGNRLGVSGDHIVISVDD
ncbi:MAG: hypothetical protein C0469_08140 [Cyanobacteria bacterium DS2.3.42]|nr:hypothetical protein [Cyanobacteria bacterium DS2.3.42]